jgi:hypothetical protein
MPRWVGRSCTEQPNECRTPAPGMTASTYPTNRSKRLRHVRHVTLLAGTLLAGGSAQLEPAPGSSAQSDIRQSGVTAWNTGLRLGDERPDFRRATKTRPPQTMAFSGRACWASGPACWPSNEDSVNLSAARQRPQRQLPPGGSPD